MNELFVALAIVLVIEGILPFLSPSSMRKYMAQMSQMDDQTLRITGFISMVIGVGLLYLVK